MLILLKQYPTGLYASDPYGQQVEVYEQIFFDTSDASITTNLIAESNLIFFEMNLDQLIHQDGSTEYRYDGNGGFYATLPPTNPKFSLSLQVNPPNSGTVQDLTNLGPYEAGQQVNLSANPTSGFRFVSWTRNGLVISSLPSFTFSMPASNVILIANFQTLPPDPEPEPEPSPERIPDSFYDLELRVGGIQIPMPPFVQKSVEGLLSDILEGEHSYPVNIPLSPKEMNALGLPNDPQTAKSFSEPISAEIWSHGNLRYRGHLDVLKADEERIRCSFILDSGFFIAKNKELKISQCYTDEDIIDLSNQTVYAVGGYELRFNYRDIRVQVNSQSKAFLKAQYEDHVAMLEAIVDWLISLGLGLSISVEYSDDLTDETSKIIYWDTTTVTTCAIYVLNGPSQSGGTDRYSRARKLTSRRFDMSTWMQVDEANRIAFPTLYNRNLYEGNNDLHDGIVNRYDEAGRLYVSNIRYLSYSESFRWEHAIIPFLYLTDVVKQIFRHLNIQISGEFFEHDLVKRMLVYNNHTLDFITVTSNNVPSRRTSENIHRGDKFTEQTTFYYENTHDLLIKLANHAPNYSVIDFLKGLKNYFGLKYNFNVLQNRVEIKFVRSIIRSRQFLDLTTQSGKVFTLHHGKENGYAFTYENPDPIMQDGVFARRNDEAISTDSNGALSLQSDFTVQNFLALDSLDAELFQIAYVESLRAWFRLVPDQSNPPFWKLYAFRQQSDVTASAASPPSGGGRRGWTLTLYPLIDSWINGRKMPAIECTANNREVKLENLECGLRLFAFYGEQEDSAGGKYAFASCTRYNAKELLSAEQYDLDIRSEDIYPFHADQERIITAGKEYETALLLSSYNLLHLSKSPIIRIANLDYLLEEKEVQNTSREFAVAKVKLYKIK